MTIPPETIPNVCTMRQSTRFLQAKSRRLVDCCAAAGVSLVDAHSALGDARATAELFGHYLAAAGGELPWQSVVERAETYPWPRALFAEPTVQPRHRPA